MSPQAAVSLAELTTLGVGGPARWLARWRTLAELREALRFAARERLPVFVLGGGSNLLVADSGFDGVVVRSDAAGVEIEASTGGAVRLRAGAGVDWDQLVALAVERGLGGLECLSGIPGLVGAAPIQNVGAYGQEVAETIETVETVELSSGAERVFAAADCGFGYRWSHFKGRWRERFAVTAVRFRLEPRQAGAVRYPELRRRLGLGERGTSAPSLAEVRREVLAVRREKSMVLDPDDPNRRSAGSFFLNPVVGGEQLEEVRRRLADRGVESAEMPVFPAPGGRYKLSAAWLIERAGFHRGLRHRGAAISTRHSLALVNRGGASARDLLELALRVQRGVLEASGVHLHPEPRLLGFGSPPPLD